MRPIRVAARWILAGLAGVFVLAALVGQVFAGSASRLAEGVTIAGVDVGGLPVDEALARLEARAVALAHEPVAFTAAAQRFEIDAATLGVRADWAGAVESAQREGEGFGPVRGFKRLATRFFGSQVAPPVTAYAGALDYKLAELAAAIDRDHVEARLGLKGLRIVAVPGRSGRRLDEEAAGRTIVRSLASLDRLGPVALPVRLDPVEVTTADLAPAAAQARIAVSEPVRLAYGETRWRLPRSRIASLLSLPKDGATRIAIAGPGAETYFERLRKTVERDPVDAGFALGKGNLPRVVPAKDGIILDVPATAKALLAAAGASTQRVAQLAVRPVAAERTTAEAAAMGITGVVGTYATTYGGIPNRLYNVALVARLIDDKLIAPGDTFSFNGTTGERNASTGFREAPVIINGELQTGIGGGVCQVSTTTFNAAYEAGLQIDERWNHALYISHYPLARDATVNYPDQDLKFTNDTGKWLWLRTFVGSGSLTVTLYGMPQNRKVESTSSPLSYAAAPKVKKIKDPTLPKGKSVVESTGTPARYTSAHRLVYDADGKLLHDDVWRSSYVSEPKVVRVGTKKPQTDEEKLAALLAAAAAAGATTQP